MASLKECSNKIITNLEFIKKAFDNLMCQIEYDASDFITYGYRQLIVKAIPQKGSLFKDYTTYVKGDIVTFQNNIYIAKRSSIGQHPLDPFYFRFFNTERGTRNVQS